MKIIQKTFSAHGGVEATNEDIAREIERQLQSEVDSDLISHSVLYRKHGNIDLIMIFKYKGIR